VYLATSVISTTTAKVMLRGLRILFPSEANYRTLFTDVPNERSPVHIALGPEHIFVAVKVDINSQFGEILVGAIDTDRRVAWQALVPAGEVFPRGLHAEPDGSVLMIDDNGIIYQLHQDTDGNVITEINEALNSSLDNDLGTPLRHLVVSPGAGPGGNDVFIILAHERSENHLLGRIRLGNIFGGRAFVYDDGVGLENGETLSPRVMAFDPSRTRLVVIDDQGRLQVLDASADEKPRRYITKWGQFGRNDGEFLVLPPTAIAVTVDNQGLIYVADRAGDTGRIQVFAP
jgi:hypothetical protein